MQSLTQQQHNNIHDTTQQHNNTTTQQHNDIHDTTQHTRLLADDIYKERSQKVEININNVKAVFDNQPDRFEKLLSLCPNFHIILAHALVLRLGVRVEEVDWTRDTMDWDPEDCRLVGRAIATVMRMCQTGEATLGAWKLNYPQLSLLFEEVEGFEEFMLVVTNNLLRDNKFGMIFRVGTGALLSTVDAMTDIYVLITYYQSDELVMQAWALTIMLLVNMMLQFLTVFAQYNKKSLTVKVKEVLISLFFLRPAVDAYRISTNYKDDEELVEPLTQVSKPAVT